MTMPSFNKTCESFFKEPQFLFKFLCGGLLSYIPIINFVIFGYFWKLAQDVKQSKAPSLPNFTDWGKLFIEGCYLLLISIFFVGAPLTVGWLLTELLYGISGGYLGPFAEIPRSLAIFVSPMMWAIGIYLFLGKPDWSIFFNFRNVDMQKIKRLVLKSWKSLVVPSLAFLALLVLPPWPFFGFAFFLGGGIFLTHALLVFTSLDFTSLEK